MYEEKLIEAIKMHNCIYDKSLSAYRNKIIKEKAWVDVAAAVGENENVCQTRWRSLRDRFLKEVNKKKTKSGSEASEESSWKFFEAMSFLKEHTAPRRTFTNTNWGSSDTLADFNFPGSEKEIDVPPLSLDDSMEHHFFEESQLSTDTPSTSRQPKKKKDAAASEANDRFEVLMGAVENIIATKTEEKSRNSDFYKVLDGYLLKLPVRRQDTLKMSFLNLVFDEIRDEDV